MGEHMCYQRNMFTLAADETARLGSARQTDFKSALASTQINLDGKSEKPPQRGGLGLFDFRGDFENRGSITTNWGNVC